MGLGGLKPDQIASKPDQIYYSPFFALVESLYEFLTRHKVHEVFVSIQAKYGVAVRELGRLGDTRWACRHRNIVWTFWYCYWSFKSSAGNRWFGYCGTCKRAFISSTNSSVCCMPRNFLSNFDVVPWREQNITDISSEYCPIWKIVSMVSALTT